MDGIAEVSGVMGCLYDYFAAAPCFSGKGSGGGEGMNLYGEVLCVPLGLGHIPLGGGAGLFSEGTWVRTGAFFNGGERRRGRLEIRYRGHEADSRDVLAVYALYEGLAAYCTTTEPAASDAIGYRVKVRPGGRPRKDAGGVWRMAFLYEVTTVPL